jgi:2-keto-4-pentenoate hydratase/2-oxohepta-3-ene-1,7-dioic acid hydratase in catechol pathway
MKVMCIGRNYADHAREMKADLPTQPVIFLKPDTAVLRNNDPFYYPDFSRDIHHEVEVVYRVGRPGKYIAAEFAWRHIDGVGLGIDFTARDLQAQLKAQSLPWDISKGFNGSAPVSKFLPLDTFADHADLHFRLEVNGHTRQVGHTAHQIFALPQLIEYASQFFTFNTGDLIFTGTPAGVGPVHSGERLRAWLQDTLLLDFEVV